MVTETCRICDKYRADGDVSVCEVCILKRRLVPVKIETDGSDRIILRKKRLNVKEVLEDAEVEPQDMLIDS